jgi:hypothetical protein
LRHCFCSKKFFFIPPIAKNKKKDQNYFCFNLFFFTAAFSDFLSTNVWKKKYLPPNICAQKVTKLCSKKKQNKKKNNLVFFWVFVLRLEGEIPLPFYLPKNVYLPKMTAVIKIADKI